MSNVIVDKKILEDAMFSGYKYIETNNLKQATKYLQFVYDNTEEKDQYLVYGLASSYYGMGNFLEVKKILNDINIDSFESTMLRKSLEQMKKEVDKLQEATIEIDDDIYYTSLEKLKNKLSKVNKEDVSINDSTYHIIDEFLEFDDKIREIRKNLLIELEDVNVLYNETHNIFFNLIANFDFFSVKDFINELEHNNASAEEEKLNEDFFINLINEFVKSTNYTKEIYDEYFLKKETIKILKLYDIANITRDKNAQLLIIYQGLKSGLFKEIYNDIGVDKAIKNIIFYYITFFNKKTNISKKVIEEWWPYKGEVDFKDFNDKVIEIEKLANIKLKDEKVLKYALKLINNYCKANFTEYRSFKEEEIINKILIYLYLSDYEISDEITKKLDPLIQKKTINTEEILEEIYKISSF